MRIAIGVMVAFYILTFWISGIISQLLFPWGGVPETHLHPIYMGMILLSGLIVFCTTIVLDEIKALKGNKKENNSDK